MDKLTAVKITDKEIGKTYELDFDRESVKFAERHGFVLADVLRFPTSLIPDLFYYSFRAKHRDLSRQQTDRMFDDKFGGSLPEKMLERLMQLFDQAQTSVVSIEGDEKNSSMTVEL